MIQTITVILSCTSRESGFSRPELLFFHQACGENFDELVLRIFRTIQTHSLYFIPCPEENWHEDDSLFVSVKCTREDHYPYEIKKALKKFFDEDRAVLCWGKVC